MYKFIIADDHPVVRIGVKEIINEAYPFAEVTGVSSAEELMNLVSRESWDLVITDISMPGRSGLEFLADIRGSHPSLPVLILSMHAEEEYAIQVLKAGGAGYLSKENALESELIKAIELVMQGRKYITTAQAELLAGEISGNTEKKPHQLLSPREYSVFEFLAKGETTSNIAERLSLSVNTIGSFRKRILEKMHLKSNADLVAYAIKNNLIR